MQTITSADGTPPYAVRRELEDLAAVIAAAGGWPHVVGHSSGAVLALEAAAAGVPLERLVAYEPEVLGPVLRDFLARAVNRHRRSRSSTRITVAVEHSR